MFASHAFLQQRSPSSQTSHHNLFNCICIICTIVSPWFSVTMLIQCIVLGYEQVSGFWAFQHRVELSALFNEIVFLVFGRKLILLLAVDACLLNGLRASLWNLMKLNSRLEMLANYGWSISIWKPRLCILAGKEQSLLKGVCIVIIIIIIIPFSKWALLAVHSVQLSSESDGEEDKYLSVTLDWLLHLSYVKIEKSHDYLFGSGFR